MANYRIEVCVNVQEHYKFPLSMIECKPSHGMVVNYVTIFSIYVHTQKQCITANI